VKLSIALLNPISGCCPTPPPPPTLINGKEEYEVEAILDSQLRYNHLEYLVKWKGYNDSHNSWQVYQNLHTKAKVAKFHHDNSGAARHIDVAIFNSIPFT
jgi:hypothetical protein